MRWGDIAFRAVLVNEAGTIRYVSQERRIHQGLSLLLMEDNTLAIEVIKQEERFLGLVPEEDRGGKWTIERLLPCSLIKDKIGEEVFEGAVIETIGDEGERRRHEIVFHDGGFLARGANGSRIQIGSSYGNRDRNKYIKIVGYIYEDPELMYPKPEEDDNEV